MKTDRPGAQEELARDLAVAHSQCAQPGDLQLLRGQLVDGSRLMGRHRDPGGAQLRLRSIQPRLCLQLGEDVLSGAQLPPGLRLEPEPAQRLSELELGLGHFERVNVIALHGHRGFEFGQGLVALRDQRTSPMYGNVCPGGRRTTGPALHLLYH